MQSTTVMLPRDAPAVAAVAPRPRRTVRRPLALPDRLPLESIDKSSRALARKRRHPDDLTVNQDYLTFLEHSSGTRKTESSYAETYHDFLSWCKIRRLPHRSLTSLDLAALTWMHDSFGQGGTPAEVSTYPARVHSLLAEGQSRGAPELPRSRMGLRGFQRLAPARSRLPLPWPVACLMIEWLIKMKRVQSAMATALTFACYTRPSETLRIRVQDTVPPPLAGAVNLRH